MIRNNNLPVEKINKGDNFFMLSKDYEKELEKLPIDVLKNMIVELKKENDTLKKQIRELKSTDYGRGQPTSFYDDIR